MKTGSWRIERPFINQDICIACGTCERNCPTNVITVDKEKKEKVSIDWDYCKGCGICSEVCPKSCIEMVSEKGENK
jgi:2-oxoacid:acceptor oxidoreductase delta subunit (pyruvate/2-ketoisovalerate family)